MRQPDWLTHVREDVAFCRPCCELIMLLSEDDFLAYLRSRSNDGVVHATLNTFNMPPTAIGLMNQDLNRK